MLLLLLWPGRVGSGRAGRRERGSWVIHPVAGLFLLGELLFKLWLWAV